MRYIILILFLIQGFVAFTQNEIAKLQPQIDSMVNTYCEEYSIVGMSIGIVHDIDAFTFNYGKTSQHDGYSVSNQTMFHVASLTKVFTATAIMQLVEQKKLSLNDKLINILPEFKMRGKGYDAITIKHLLTHTSGLPWTNKQNNLPEDNSSIPLFMKGLHKLKLNFSPGGQFSGDTYSNIAFDLLGIVIEKITGQPYHQYIYSNVLAPVGIEEVSFFYEEIDPAFLAIPQVVDGTSRRIQKFNQYRVEDKKNPIMNGEPLALRDYETYGEPFIDNPAGNLITTSTELNKWTRYLIQLKNGEVKNTESIIRKETLNEMWTISETIPGYKVSLGLTWWIFDNSDLGRYICHYGNNPGFCSVLIIFPEENLGINILCNGMYAQDAVFDKIPFEIAEIFIKNKPTN